MSDVRETRDLLHDVRSGDRWLVVVAHPDDESFGCGSVIAHAAGHGADVTVACATRGESGQPPADLPDPGRLGAIREAELRRASALLGATRVELLGYRDSGFDGDPGPGSLCATPLGDVAAVVHRLAAQLRPVVVVTLDGSDGHRDHVHVRDAVRRALCRLPHPPALYEYTVPNSLMRRWLAETSATRGDDVYHALDPDSLGRPDTEITDVLDGTAVLDLREAAIAEHRSQISPFEGLGDEVRRTFLLTDHLVRVQVGLPRGPWPEPRGRDRTYWDCETAAWREVSSDAPGDG